MDKTNLLDFLLLDERNFDDCQKAFYYIKDYIAEFKGKYFQFQLIADLWGHVLRIQINNADI